MRDNNNLRYRIARTREQAHEFVDAIFDGDLAGDPTAAPGEPGCIEVLLVGVDLNYSIGETKNGASRMIAKSAGRGEQLYEPDSTGAFIASRTERLNCFVTEPLPKRRG
jgi:hypothetical protein